MSKDEMPTEKLGEYKGRNYFLYAYVEPSFNKIKEYVITVYYKKINGEKEQIGRFDTSHDHKHFDKLFEDHPYKDAKPSTPTKSFWELYEYAKNNWKKWAKRYEE